MQSKAKGMEGQQERPSSHEFREYEGSRNPEEEALLLMRSALENRRGTREERAARREAAWDHLRVASRNQKEFETREAEKRSNSGGEEKSKRTAMAMERAGTKRKEKKRRNHRQSDTEAVSSSSRQRRGNDIELLMAASKMGDANQVAAILGGTEPVKVTWRDNRGYLALHWAALYGHLEVVRVLLGAGAGSRGRIDRVNEAQNTALHCACLGQHAAVACLLVRYGADPFRANACGQTPVSLGLRALQGRAAEEERWRGVQAVHEGALSASFSSEAWELNERQMSHRQDATLAEAMPPSRLAQAWAEYDLAWAQFSAMALASEEERSDLLPRHEAPQWEAELPQSLPGEEQEVPGGSSAAGLRQAGGGAGLAPDDSALRPRASRWRASEGREHGGCVPKCIRFADVPWPLISPAQERPLGQRWPQNEAGDGRDLILGKLELPPATLRPLVRRELLRWHPDKFQQTFGRHLAPQDRDAILQEVQRTSQMLNSLSSSTS